jgi:hypothetical protein
MITADPDQKERFSLSSDNHDPAKILENLKHYYIVDENVAPSGLYSADSLLHLSPGHQSAQHWVGFISPAIKEMGHPSHGGGGGVYNIECSDLDNCLMLPSKITSKNV